MSCSKKVLASRDKFGCVYECGCGTIYVSVSAVDIKFTHEGLLDTYAMLAEAVQRLKPRSPESFPEIDETVRLLIDSSQVHIN